MSPTFHNDIGRETGGILHSIFITHLEEAFTVRRKGLEREGREERTPQRKKRRKTGDAKRKHKKKNVGR